MLYEDKELAEQAIRESIIGKLQAFCKDIYEVEFKLKCSPMDFPSLYDPYEMERSLEYFIHVTPNQYPSLERFTELPSNVLSQYIKSVVTNHKDRKNYYFNPELAQSELKELWKDVELFAGSEIDSTVSGAIEEFLVEVIKSLPLPESWSIPKSERRAVKGLEDGLSGALNCSTLIRVCNSGRRGDKVGNRDRVRYFVIDILNGVIVPIAIADEHHMGMDLVHDMIEAGKLPDSIYVPISINGFYCNSDDDKSYNMKILRACEIWLKNGGIDGIVTNSRANMSCRMSEFVKNGGVVKSPVKNKSGLTSHARIIIDNLRIISMAIKADLSGRNYNENQVWQSAETVVKAIATCPLFTYQYEIDHAKFKEISDKSDFKALEQFIFAFDGVKNKFHIALKNLLGHREKRGNDVREDDNIYGDLVEFEKQLASTAGGI